MLPANPPAPLLGVYDGDSEVQQRIATMQARYAQNVQVPNADDEIIILPKEDALPAPEPPPQEVPFDPIAENPVLRRVKEYRDAAAKHYQRAIALFGEVIRLSDADDPWGREARLLTAMCYAEMDDTQMANDHFRSLIETFPKSSEAAVACFFLGEYDRANGNTDAAFRAFEYAFNNIRRNPRYSSFWLPKTEIVERSTDMIRNDLEKQHHAEAAKLLGMLRGVMPQAEILQMTGETNENWAELLQSQAETIFGEEGNRLVKEAESKWRSAGAAFGELAQLLSDTLDYSNLLWRSAENYRLGKDYRRAVVGYRNFIAADLIRRRPEVNLRLGEMYFQLDFLDEAAYLLAQGLNDYPAHNLVPLIRLLLSHVYYEQKKWDEAKTLLRQNLVGEESPESATYRDAMYALGNVSFIQGDLDAAIPYLEDALKIHPNAAQAAEAHYSLAQAYLKKAEDQFSELTDNTPAAAQRTIESLVAGHRQQALFHLAKTEEILTDRQRVMGLTESEKLMLRNAQFSNCTVLMTMEQYEQVIPRLNALATMYQDRAETLDALVKMAFSLRMVGRDTESQTTLRQAEVILSQLEKAGAITDGTNWRNVIQGQMKR